MDIIDKIFSKLSKDQAPADLRAKILDIPHRQPTPGKFWQSLKVAVPALLVVAMLAGGVYYKYFSVPNFAAAFELAAQDSDSAGVSPDSVFILKSSKDITAAQVRKIVKINPEVDFEVKSLGGNRFQIKPQSQLSGNTIYQVSIAEGAAERDYSWAFQVRAPFAAVSTFPRHQGTGVPVNSSVEMTFNRENVQNIDKYFSVSPEVKGRFEVRNDTVVFLPASPLKERTVYTITVKKGLTAKGVDEPLAEDIVFAFETSGSGYYPGNYFNFSSQLFNFPPTQAPTFILYEYGMDFSQAEAGVYAFSGKDQFLQSYYQSRNWELGWAYYYRQDAGSVDTGKLAQVTTFKPQIIKMDYQNFLQLPDKLPAGYYLVDLKVGDKRAQAWVLVNDISNYYSLTDNNGFVWAYQFSEKKPLTDATVAYYDSSGRRQELGKTNDQGLAQFGVPDALKNKNSQAEDYGKPKFIEITKQGQTSALALVSAGWWYYGGSSGNQDDFWKYLSTDRFTYQLSDTIKFWGVIKGKSEDYKNQKVKIQLREGYYSYFYYSRPGFEQQDRPLAETEAQISQFDSINGSLSYKGLKAGTYQIIVLLNDNVVAQSNVEVMAYTKPLYQVTVTPSKPAVFAGQSVDFNIKAQFYDGTGVGAMKLKYSGSYGSRQLSGNVSLNSRGEGKVTFTPEYQQSSYYPIGLYLNFSPAQAEEGDINSNTEANVSVFGPRIFLQASQKYSDNNNFSITAKANDIVLEQSLDTRGGDTRYWDYIGAPASGQSLTAEVEKTEYLKIENGTYYDAINKTVNPSYRYEEKRSIVNRYSGTTNSKGEWQFDLSLPKADRTSYLVKISGVDSLGHTFTTSIYPYYYRNYGNVYMSGQAAKTSNRVVLSLGFKDNTDTYNTQFSVGQRVEMVAEAVEGQQFLNGQTLFYRYGHKGIGKLEVVNGKELSDTFASDFRPAVSYRAVVFGPYGFVESNTVMAAYKQEDAKLNIQIKPDKEAYRPGDKAKVEVEIKDKNGQAAKGEVNFSTVDEAVFDILPYYWQQDILQSLYQVDYSEPRSRSSDFTPAEQGAGGQGGAEKGGCFLAGTKILLPGGKYKNIEDIKVGDLVLTRAKEDDSKKLVAAIVQGVDNHTVGDYLVINNDFKVTGEHTIYLNGKWQPAGLAKVGDTLQDEAGKSVVIASIKRVLAPQTKVYNFIVGKQHTYFAGGFFVHNAEKGGGYRSEFLDTAHYESKELDNGKAMFEFSLPDNITSWRATVSAFDSNKIFAGQESKLLPATLPFFTDTVISSTYLAGDKPTVVARAFGTNFDPNAETTFNLEISGLDFKKSLSSRTGSADFVLPALNSGNYELKLQAKQGNLTDGVIRKFAVVDSYFTVAQPKVVSIGPGQTGLTNDAKGYTDVTFTDLGKARFYNQLSQNKYQYGKRADQVTVSVLAQKMLKDYFGEGDKVEDLDLSAYHVPQGGLGLFTYGDSDLALSAKISDLAPDSVFQTQLVPYFKSAMRDSKADLSRISSALYGLAALNQPVLPKLQMLKDEKDLQLEDKMYIALGLAKLGDRENARVYYYQQIRPELHFEGNEAWLDKESDQTRRVKLTALAGAVASAVRQDQDALAVWEYLQGHYPSQDLDVLERFLIIRDLISRAPQTEASFTYRLGNDKTEIKLERGQSKTVQFSQDELANIAFEGVKGQPAALFTLEQSQDPDQLNKNSQLTIKRSFWVDGREVPSVEEGDTVIVRLEYQIAKNAIDGGYQVVDYLPSGLRPVTNIWQRGLSYAYAQCFQKGEPMAVDGNKVYFSAYHSRDYPSQCATYTLEYYARAAAKGEFNVNPPLIQSLNNYESLNVGSGQKLIITSAPRE